MKLIVCFAALAFSGILASAQVIPIGSSVYVNANNGFDIFIDAAMQSKGVPVVLVSSADKADYVLDSSLFHMTGFIATRKFSTATMDMDAAFKLTDKSGTIVWSYVVMKGMLSRGHRSVSESCAKHLKEAMVGKQRRGHDE